MFMWQYTQEINVKMFRTMLFVIVDIVLAIIEQIMIIFIQLSM